MKRKTETDTVARESRGRKMKKENQQEKFTKEWAERIGLKCAIKGGLIQFLVTSPNGSRIQSCFGYDHAHGFLRGYEAHKQVSA